MLISRSSKAYFYNFDAKLQPDPILAISKYWNRQLICIGVLMSDYWQMADIGMPKSSPIQWLDLEI